MGFAIPTPLLPIVYDFHPCNSRIAVLILNTRPHRLALFTIHAPSMVQDQRLDPQRKHEFWEHLHSVFNHYLSGNFNTRPYHNQISGLEFHIGPSTFSSAIENGLLPSTNLSFMIHFLQDNELSIVYSMRPRPPSQIITYL